MKRFVALDNVDRLSDVANTIIIIAWSLLGKNDGKYTNTHEEIMVLCKVRWIQPHVGNAMVKFVNPTDAVYHNRRKLSK